MKKILLLSWLVVICLLASSCGSKENKAQKQKDIRTLLDLTGTGARSIKSGLITVLASNMRTVPNQAFEAVISKDDIELFLAKAVDTYDKRFTHEEVKQLIKFYKQPCVQKYGNLQPQISIELGNEGQILAAQLSSKWFGKLQEMGFTQQLLDAKNNAQINLCLNNLRIIDAAKQKAVQTLRLKSGQTVSPDQIAPFIQNNLQDYRCLAGGVYKINSIGQSPSCSIHGNVNKPIFPAAPKAPAAAPADVNTKLPAKK